MPVPRTIIDQIKHIIPPLNGTLHKGQSGRVGVFGGALDYTGAPYFAAISALRLGADLSHVICAPSAAQAIKSYSPDLIVHPILVSDGPQNKVKSELDALLSRLHVLIIGPGLGREPYMQHYARTALLSARSLGLFLVLDADALWMIGQENDGDHMGLIKGYARAVLTPNVVEFGRLCKWVGVGEDVPGGERAGEVSKRLGGVVVLEKGKKDIIAVDTNAKDDQGNDVSREVIGVDVEGGPRRCGGQGDVLSGCVGAMLAWGKCFEDGAFGNGSIPSARLPILAAVGGSMVTRTSSKRAFRVEGRGLVTEDMIPHLAKAFSEVFGEEFQGGDKGKL